MEAGVTALLILLGLAFFGGFIWWSIELGRRQKENLAKVARRYGGSIKSKFWSGTEASLKIDGHAAKLRFFNGTDKSPPWTRIQYDCRPPGNLRVSPQGFFANFKKFFGAQDIIVGYPAFDDRYLIQGKPQTWVRKVLDRNTCNRLLAMADIGTGFLRGSGIRVDAGPAGITFYCQRNLVRKSESIAAFVDQSATVFRVLMADATTGAEILSVEEVIRDGACPVCGQSLQPPIRRCTECRTPHHQDCWTYFGSCAIYGCKG